MPAGLNEPSLRETRGDSTSERFRILSGEAHEGARCGLILVLSRNPEAVQGAAMDHWDSVRSRRSSTARQSWPSHRPSSAAGGDNFKFGRWPLLTSEGSSGR